ncbi:hypothetical protein [Metaclostridioides mangenotii]|uniref:Antitoxin n=1 Tax=Metaclostridioides mangenotii TaxID=1540 RepID=A0ABS4EEM6_9FIRM|nr:hypothetical protein [Clostridioides mangenotii]MBP1856399.1 hypothetical protein [Clostridioides mangenotii]
MEIKIRNLSATTVNELNLISKKKGITRQQLLKNYIDKLALSYEVIEVESKYETLVKKVLGVIDLNTKTINSFMEENIIDLNNSKEEY